MSHEEIPISQISLGAPATHRLSASQKIRIHQIAEEMAEVYPQSDEEWIDGFAADRQPEREIVIWEIVALAYSSFVQARDLSTAAKREVLNLALNRSLGCSEQAVLKKPLAELTGAEREAFLDTFDSVASSLEMLC